MSQRSILAGLLVFVIVAFGGMIFYDMKHGKKFDKLFNKQDQTTNWKWEDDWKSQGPNTPPPTRPTDQVPPVTPPAQPTGPQIVASSYAEAIQKSGQTGKPVLAFFTADWCTWCKKMKSETMPNEGVQTMMKNYVLVYVDTDKDRAPARKFGVESLPSYVITNSKEEKLKSDSGFKNAETFAQWLNNPNLFNQSGPQVRPPSGPPEKKQDDRNDSRRRPLRRDGDRTPPQASPPPIQPGSPGCPPGGT